MGLSMVRSDQPARLYGETIRVSLWAVLGLWLARRLARLFLLIVRSHSAVIAITVTAAGVAGWKLVHWVLPVSVVAVLATGLVGWWMAWPASFEQHVRLRWRSWWRGQLIYRFRWTKAMDTAGLTKQRHGTDYVPPLRRIRSTRSVDRVLVRMLPGQTVEDYALVADRLAQTFGVEVCRVRSVPKRRHQVELWLLVHDPLDQTVAPFPLDPDCLTKGIPVALAEDGTTWRLQLVGTHVVVDGATGSGKSEGLWGIIAGLVDQIAAGLVKIWAVDPKGGMEFAAGRHLFDRFAYGDSRSGGSYEESLAVLLEDAVQVTRERQDRLRGVTRLHTPSVAEPLIVLLIDELAALTAWVNDRAIKKRMETALGLLLSQGRAPGVVIVGAVQEARKDIVPQRGLLPVRVGMRMNEAEEVHLFMGVGARNRGATCDLIPDTMPGVAYVAIDGIAEPIRVRFAHYTDDNIAQLGRPTPVERPLLSLIEDPEVAA
jgi:DNA segregation ATPase FtsK/SpoIIIE, S-DNA-T family